MKKNNIRQSVVAWNNRFPLDRWWRKKYDVPYLSEKHRESSFFWQYWEYYEDVVFKEHYDKKDEDGDSQIPDKYIPLKDNWWKGKGSSKEEIDDWFNSSID